MMVEGRIHSVETFGTVDGPGIRYIVFTQGCPLRCRFCHNRDTWDVNGGKVTTAEDIIKDALKYKTFMDASGGGITVSGGESTLQIDFVAEIFRLAKKNGISTCLDTSGFVNLSKIDKILENTDLVLLDIKHMDNEKSIWLTGQTSERARALAKHLDELGIHVWIRHVLIPGVSDMKRQIEALAKFVKGLNNVDRVEFLPYHTLGVHKWEEMGLDYGLKDVRPADDEDVKRAKAIFDEIINS